MKLARGDVVLCRVPMPSTELRDYKFRPGIIVSKDPYNRRLDDVIIAICTSNISRRREPTHYLIEGDELAQAGIRVSSIVRCESLLTINKSMIIRILGSLSKDGMHRVNACLKDALQLD